MSNDKYLIIEKYVDLSLELTICKEKGWQVQGMIVSAQKRLLCELEPRLANVDVEVMGVAVGDFHNWYYLVLDHQQASQHSYAKVARALRNRLDVELACSCGEGVKRC